MSWYSRVQIVAGCAWAWLCRDYHWVGVLLFPVGLAVYLMRKPTVIEVVGSELTGADNLSDVVRTELLRKDEAAKEVRDRKVQQATSARDAKVSDLITEQQEETTTLADSPNALTDTMLRVGKDVRR